VRRMLAEGANRAGDPRSQKGQISFAAASGDWQSGDARWLLPRRSKRGQAAGAIPPQQTPGAPSAN
jgi:hypothetical protein